MNGHSNGHSNGPILVAVIAVVLWLALTVFGEGGIRDLELRVKALEAQVKR